VIALIDYQAGNLTSVKKALTTIGADVFVPEGPDALREARGIIVPGVGHFGATRALEAAWIEGILERIGEGRPLLGIVRMHWFRGRTRRPTWGRTLVGYAGGLASSDAIAIHTPGGTRVPAARSVLSVADRRQISHTAMSRHGKRRDGRTRRAFSAVVQRANIAGVQFHPEKSGELGLQILRNFIQLAG
jgi:glutamine amidotransferase